MSKTVDGYQGVVYIGSRVVWRGKKVLDKGTAEYDANRAANMYRDRNEATGKVSKRRTGVAKVKVKIG